MTIPYLKKISTPSDFFDLENHKLVLYENTLSEDNI